MGCTPSQFDHSILVEERHSAQSPNPKDFRQIKFNGSFTDESSWPVANIIENETDSNDSGDGFLQESMNSNSSHLSTKSNASSDSGNYDLEDDYSYIITENSDPEKVQEVNNQFVPNDDLELIIVGKACPRKLSSKDKERLEQQAVLEMLREEGLIVRPPSKAVGGLRFELVSSQQFPNNGSSSLRRLPPIAVRKKHKKKKKPLTYEEIQLKLIKAEERRKRKTEEKLSKIPTKPLHEIQANVEQQIEQNRQKLEEKLQAKSMSREQHLNEVQEKIKAREEHANKVRRRKQMIANGFPYVLENIPNL
ncbi:uncharacterized protein LOC129231508 [Uloborus diversus]|uniref:uncharacterized protein LOC129231508 n=1 Tax=Uloborus diversus TaxID=327109 RepID=UPI00240A3C6B|nr:uncharacterized protein LOC129231508 [Uloborus diversus]XP_054721814.1 uncharacterized protein LOC129231508 [Uloborus diversus]XP_054721815.1 uncharacterized protein LOC129231508 [Uloborus diversus]